MGRPPPRDLHAVSAAEVPLQDRVKEGGLKENKLARPKIKCSKYGASINHKLINAPEGLMGYPKTRHIHKS